MIIYFFKIQSNESLTAGTSRCRRMGNIEKAAAGFKDKRVLDLGCGYGWHCIYAMEHGASSVVGVDISHKMLEVAKRKNTFSTG